MFIVGKSFFSEILSKFNIKTIAPLFVIHIPRKMCLAPKITTFLMSEIWFNQKYRI